MDKFVEEQSELTARAAAARCAAGGRGQAVHGFRLSVTLDEELRAMIFETRRSKQDLLIEFVTAGVQAWRRDRAKRK